MASEDWSRWLDRYPPRPELKPGEYTGRSEQPAEHRIAARRLPIDDELDLHGCTIEDALARTTRFIETSVAAGYAKVLVIHGKGNHNNGESLLRGPVRALLASHPAVGQTGTPGIKQGGEGAVWAVLRYRSR